MGFTDTVTNARLGWREKKSRIDQDFHKLVLAWEIKMWRNTSYWNKAKWICSNIYIYSISFFGISEILDVCA